MPSPLTNTLYGLTAADVERLRRLLSLVERGDDFGPLQQGGRRPLRPSSVICGALTSAAAAVSGIFGTPTVAVLNVYSFSSTGKEDTTLDVNVYNMAPTAATTDRWTIAERDSFTGKYVITTQFCS